MVDDIAKDCKILFKKYQVGGYKMKAVNNELGMFAADVVLLADSEEK